MKKILITIVLLMQFAMAKDFQNENFVFTCPDGWKLQETDGKILVFLGDQEDAKVYFSVETQNIDIQKRLTPEEIQQLSRVLISREQVRRNRVLRKWDKKHGQKKRRKVKITKFLPVGVAKRGSRIIFSSPMFDSIIVVNHLLSTNNDKIFTVTMSCPEKDEASKKRLDKVWDSFRLLK